MFVIAPIEKQIPEPKSQNFFLFVFALILYYPLWYVRCNNRIISATDDELRKCTSEKSEIAMGISNFYNSIISDIIFIIKIVKTVTQ